ncbi:YqzH family protein [Metabacillus sp. RGM 3146]|uniref:YqzH family protein n=1 Tax=Metabacillus sp. RGM 3146 TaxID=3401092 RepID=UPI003B9C44E4
MEKIFFRKMLEKAFPQYGRDIEASPLSEEELKELGTKLKEEKEENPQADLHELIEDVVYAYITNQD